MKIFRQIIIMFLFNFSLSFGQQKVQKNSSLIEYSISDLHHDAEVLKAVLVKLHPGLYSYMNEEQFNSNYQRFLDSLTVPRTELGFHKQLLDFIADIGCGHTDTRLSESGNKQLGDLQLLPFEVDIIDSLAFIRRNFTTFQELQTGVQILRINGMDINEVVKRLKPYSWADGFYQSPDVTEPDFSVKYALVFGTCDTFQLELKSANEKLFKFKAPAMSSNSIDKIIQSRFSNYSPSPKLRFLSDSKTAVLSEVVFSTKGFKKFLKKSFEKINDLGVENLVIDLRDNGGGDDECPLWLYQYIARGPFKYYERIEAREIKADDTIFKYVTGSNDFRKAIKSKQFESIGNGYSKLSSAMHFNLSKSSFEPIEGAFAGNVYLIVNSESYSASVEFAAVAQCNKRCIIIGEETKGACRGNNSGDEFVLTLPKTHSKVFIPTFRYLSACKDCAFGRGIVPDYKIFSAPSDYTGADNVLDYTLKLIKQQNGK